MPPCSFGSTCANSDVVVYDITYAVRVYSVLDML